jgi:hypothetical protein
MPRPSAAPDHRGEQESDMSISLSFRSQTLGKFADLPGQAAPLLIRLGRLPAKVRQRHMERQMAQAVEDLGHSGVLADFRRATRL